MRRTAIVALGIAAYVAFLPVTIPATYLAARVGGASNGRVVLEEPCGTLWKGSAKARLIARGGPIFIDSLEWSFRPSRLIAGRLAFDVKAAARGLEAQLQVARGFGGWELRDVAARVEAALATAGAPAAAGWRPEGTVVVSSPALAWDSGEAHGAATVEWREAALSISEVRPLGSYRVEAQAEGGPARLNISTLGGPLKISAQGSFTPPSRLTLSGEARAEASDAKALEPLLDLIGPRRPDGARALELRIN